MIGDREVILFQDPRMLDHRPDPDAAFLPGRLDRRVREILSGLGAKWSYPEHPGRLTAVLDLLEREPVPGVRLEAGRVATRAELARVHTTSYLDGIYAMRGENAWLDMDTTAVSPGSVEAAEVAAGTAVAAVERLWQALWRRPRDQWQVARAVPLRARRRLPRRARPVHHWMRRR